MARKARGKRSVSAADGDEPADEAELATRAAPDPADRQQALFGELAAALERGQVHGAYLFEGPAGTGKRATAVAFASALLRGDPEARVVGAQGDVWSSRHPDLHLVEPDGAFIKIDQVRALQGGLALAPNEGGRRVGLVFDAERLRTEAANALLKTLEEPPAATTLLLVSAVAERLPPTLRSRTTRIRFRRQPESEVATALEAGGLLPEDAWLAAALGGGSLASARAWAERHLEDARVIRDTLETAADRSRSELLDFTEGFRRAGARERAELFFDVHQAVARRAVERAALARDPRLAQAWIARAEAAEEARVETARRNLNPQLVAEELLLDLRRAALR